MIGNEWFKYPFLSLKNARCDTRWRKKFDSFGFRLYLCMQKTDEKTNLLIDYSIAL